MINKANKQIEIIAPLQDLLVNFAEYSKKTKLKPIKIRIITEKYKQHALTRNIILPAKANQNNVEIKQTEKLPCNLLITDDKEPSGKETTLKTKTHRSFGQTTQHK